MSLPDDLWNQEVTLVFENSTVRNFNLNRFAEQQVYLVQFGINFGAQFGATAILLLVLLFLTKASKRRSYIFVINGLCLFVNAIRCLLMACLLTSSWHHPYSQLTGNFRLVSSSTIATTIVTVLLTILLTFLVFLSLSLQVWVVCVTTSPARRAVVMGLTTVAGCFAFGYRVAQAVFNIKSYLTQTALGSNEHLVRDCYIVQVIAIWVYSSVFTYKLGYAMFQRRRLNMPQFGPMQVVFIMGCQTMIVPAIITSMQFVPNAFELGSSVLTIVSVFLPLSAIWAGIDHDSGVASRGPDAHHRLFASEFYNSTAQSIGTSSSSTAFDKSRQLSVFTISKGKDKDIESMSIAPGSRKASYIQDDRDYGISPKDASHPL
ncbi:hypothetical protein NX059_001147 [Plenodomus lindquistii]|nr:hypothetical protein NX059_001147 [Plenodomus lindquistii]